jgi:hypothetical protein
MGRIVTLLFVLPLTVSAQFTYSLVQDVPVVQNNDSLSLAWSGGFNAGQFNTLDLNHDNLSDLVLYDRMAGRISTYLNGPGGYRYAPDFETFFPTQVANWILLRDFNCDGLNDLFTGDVLGIRVYKNVTQPAGLPSWELFLFSTGTAAKSEVLLTKGFSGKINLQLNADDLPSITDADGDGDLDIFNIRLFGAGTVEFHQNFSMERYQSCDSLDFERITQTWGGVEECDCGTFAFNNQPCPPGGRQQHAGGKSLLAFDKEGDGDMDLLFSESECPRIYQLNNTGTVSVPVLTSFSLFPVASPVTIFPYPAPYLLDVDGDSKSDLIASSNIFFRESSSTNLKESVWFYKNTGTTSIPQFTFQQTNFLQNQMIDVGDNAVPQLFDVDADGDLDLLIGYNVYNFQGAITYYENTGTRSKPAFTWVTDDLFSLGLFGFTNVKPQLADLNGDARTDLAFTASNQFGFNTNLFYFPNTSAVGLAPALDDLRSLNFPINASENVSVVDVNEDTSPDLLVGKANGSLQYWKNTGTAGNPLFTLEESEFLGIGSSVTRQNPAVAVGDLDADGTADLVLGDQSGRLQIIPDFKNATHADDALTELIYNNLAEETGSRNLGGRIWPTTANLFNATKPMILVGTNSGGLHLLKSTEGTTLPKTPQIDVYPNPIAQSGDEMIHIRLDRPANMYITTLLGQVVGEATPLQAFQTYRFTTGTLKRGVYLLRFVTEGESYVRRLVIY